MKTVKDIREMLLNKYSQGEFVLDRTGQKVVEILGATFLVDEDFILREPNQDYIKREIEWYESQSRFVKDIPGKTPLIWEQIASKEGMINSNYGWCIFSEENGNQYDNVLKELKRNIDSRRATMIYNRPSMHVDYNKDGMNDFMCTYSNTFLVRDGKLVSHYIMRSNDGVFGFNNDVAWAKYVHNKLQNDLGLPVGDLIWTASSLHIYERHFNLIEDKIKEIK